MQTTANAQTGPEVNSQPLPNEPKVFDDGSAYWPSATRPGVFHTLYASLQGGRMVVTECSCEAGGKNRPCWHRRAFQARLDKDRAEGEREALIEQAARCAADFERAYARRQMDPANAWMAAECREAHRRLEAARAMVRAILPGRKGN